MRYVFDTKKNNDGEYIIEVSIQGGNGISGNHKREVKCLIKDSQFHYEEAIETTLLELLNNTRLTVQERNDALEDADMFSIYCHAAILQDPVPMNAEELPEKEMLSEDHE